MSTIRNRVHAVFRSLHLDKQSCLPLLCAYLLLSVQYGFNVVGSAEQSVFHNYELWTESWVLGRLALTRDEGRFAYGGLLPVPTVEEGRAAYFDARPLSVRELYFSQSGGQAFFLSFADRHLPFTPRNRYRIFRVLTGLVFALAVWLVVLWIWAVAGKWAGLASLFATLLGLWPSSYARHIFHMSAFYLLPFLAGLYLVQLRPRHAPIRLRIAAPVLFLCLLTKIGMNGLEFISTICIMTLTPFVYEWVDAQVAWREGVRRMAVLSGSLVAAIGVGMLLLTIQIAVARGEGVSAAYEHFRYKIAHRMHDVEKTFPSETHPTLQTGTRSVIRTSLDATWIQPRSIADRWFPGRGASLPVIRFSVFLLAFGLGTVLFFLRRLYRAHTPRALLAASWFSLLAPLSWFVVFKNHSAHHPHMVPIVWHFPFVFLGMALIVQAVTPRHESKCLTDVSS